MAHEPRRLPQLVVFLFAGAGRTIFPLLHLHMPHDWVAAFFVVLAKIAITYAVIFVAKRMGLSRDHHPSRAVRVVEYAHRLVEAIPPAREILVRHMLVPSINHLPNIMKFVGVAWLRTICVANCAHDVLEAIFGHIGVEAEWGAFGWRDIFG